MILFILPGSINKIIYSTSLKTIPINYILIKDRGCVSYARLQTKYNEYDEYKLYLT